MHGLMVRRWMVQCGTMIRYWLLFESIDNGVLVQAEVECKPVTSSAQRVRVTTCMVPSF